MKKRRKAWMDNHGNKMEAVLENDTVTIRNLTDGTTRTLPAEYFDDLPGTEIPITRC
jgi:hypothetical protein